MNKLEDKFIAEGCLFANAKTCVEITTDVAIKFSQWIADSKLHGYSKQLYEAMIIHKVKTTEELFEIFINNYYVN